ncbi:hypothetical protein [Desertivirga xinjiangensis]|uniref:hypothetical protein n=1 Tax=Desertivirga xinjiangensis TaxID=539206 RepID=UPI00210EB87B|nr:hypothetical protein [Pedobacter xinjiangensis]
MNNIQNVDPDNNDQESQKDSVEDNTVDNSNQSANQDDYDSDMERIQQATEASEASFTLEAEKGLTPDPDTLNKQEERDGNNVKK